MSEKAIAEDFVGDFSSRFPVTEEAAQLMVDYVSKWLKKGKISSAGLDDVVSVAEWEEESTARKFVREVKKLLVDQKREQTLYGDEGLVTAYGIPYDSHGEPRKDIRDSESVALMVELHKQRELEKELEAKIDSLTDDEKAALAQCKKEIRRIENDAVEGNWNYAKRRAQLVFAQEKANATLTTVVVSLEDAYGDAREGLLQGIRHFDPTKATQGLFHPLIKTHIDNKIKEGFAKYSSSIHTTRPARELSAKISQKQQESELTIGRKLKISELAEALDKRESRILEVDMGLHRNIALPIDAFAPKDDLGWNKNTATKEDQLIPVDASVDMESTAANRDLLQRFRARARKLLSPFEEFVYAMNKGLEDQNRWVHTDIAELRGYTSQNISKIAATATTKLENDKEIRKLSTSYFDN